MSLGTHALTVAKDQSNQCKRLLSSTLLRTIFIALKIHLFLATLPRNSVAHLHNAQRQVEAGAALTVEQASASDIDGVFDVYVLVVILGYWLQVAI